MRFVKLRAVARAALVAGAVGSIGFMLRVGNRNGSTIPPILLVLFTGWVLSPFLALGLADILSKRRPVLAGAWLHGVVLTVTVFSLLLYAQVALGPPRPKPASVFLLVPLGSWLLIALAVPIAARATARRTPGGR